MKKIIGISISLLIVIGLVVGAVKLIKKRRAEDAHEKTATIYPIKVPTITPKTGHIKTTLKYLGIVKNSKEVTINSKFAGKIKYIVPLGSKVKKGDLLVKIDDTALKAALQEVNSNINSLKKLIDADKVNISALQYTISRTKKLLKVKMASVEEYENQKAKLALLEAKLTADKEKLKALKAKKNNILNDLTYAVITSPINGIVSAKFLNKGDNAFPGKPILTIASNQGNYLYIPLPKPYREIIYKEKVYPLTSLHSTFNGIPVYKADVNDPNLVLGEKVDIKVVTFDGNATLIPFNTLLSINGKNYVFDTRGNPIKVNIIATGQEGVVVKNNLPQIIEANPDILLKIKAGHPITIANNINGYN